MESRPVRTVGDNFGATFPIKVLRDLGIVEDNQLVHDDLEAVQKIFADGRIVIELPDDLVEDA